LNLRFIDWIWRVRGSIFLAPGIAERDALDRLDGLFQEYGTTYTRDKTRLDFRKKSPAAQDKMSVFNRGALYLETSDGTKMLRYDLVSNALLLCFLAPLLFFGFGQFFEFTMRHQDASQKPVAAQTQGKDQSASASKKPADAKDVKAVTNAKAEAKSEDKAKDDKPAVVAMNPIDKFLGAPKPPDDKKDDSKPAEKHKKLSPTTAYVFAGIFFFLYIVGRILEPFLVRRLFSRALGDLAASGVIAPDMARPHAAS